MLIRSLNHRLCYLFIRKSKIETRRYWSQCKSVPQAGYEVRLVNKIVAGAKKYFANSITANKIPGLLCRQPTISERTFTVLSIWNLYLQTEPPRRPFFSAALRTLVARAPKHQSCFAFQLILPALSPLQLFTRSLTKCGSQYSPPAPLFIAAFEPIKCLLLIYLQFCFWGVNNQNNCVKIKKFAFILIQICWMGWCKAANLLPNNGKTPMIVLLLDD